LVAGVPRASRLAALRSARLVLAAGWVLLRPTPAAPQVVAVVEVEVEGAAGHPIVGATVTSAGGTGARTDAAGRATLRGLPPGPGWLAVSALGYLASSVEIVVVNGRTTRTHVVLVPEPLRLEGIDVGVARMGLPTAAVVLLVDSLPSTVGDLPDALARVPGVTVVREGGAGAGARIQIRGSSSDQVLVLLDGVPLNTPLTGEVDLSTVDLGSLERIVVAPGAQSARYGPRALGGVVLLERRRATASRAEGTLGAGAWGERDLGGALDRAGGGAWSAAADARWSRGRSDFTYDVPAFRGGGSAGRENAAFRRVGGSARIARTTDALTTSVRLHGSDVERGSPGAVAQPSATGEQAHRRAGASLRADAGGRRAGASLLADLQWQRSVYADSTPPFGQAYRQVARVTQYALGAEGRGVLGAAALLGGVDARRVHVDSEAPTLASRSLDELGAWASVEVERALGGRWTAAVRVEGRADSHDLVEGTPLSPAATVRIADGDTRLVASLRSAFAPPGLSDLFFQEGVLVRANPELRPERVHAERSVAVEHRARVFGIGVDVGVTAYVGDVDDMILWFPDFRFVWSPDNFDVARSGIELSAGLAFDAFGAALTLTGHAAVSRVEYGGDVLGGQVAYRPERTADGLASIGLPVGAANLRVSYVGARRSVAGSALNELRSYTLVDAGFAAPLPLPAVDVRVEATVTNVLDRSAALLVDFPLPGRGWSLRLRVRAPGAP
jgi:outer membrane cobalamin receptor